MEDIEAMQHNGIRGDAAMLLMDRWMEIRSLAAQGEPIRKLARVFELDRNTIRRVLRQKQYSKYERTAKPGIMEPWMDYLANRAPQVLFNARRLFDEMVGKGFSGSYSTVREVLSPLRSQYAAVEEAFQRYETPPGLQSQVDWGSSWVLLGGARTRIHFFVMVMGYSRGQYVEFRLDETLQTLLECHENAFDWFGGHTYEIVYDNMKTVVLRRDSGTIHLHPRFEDFANTQGFKVHLCQPARPQTKGKVESVVKYVKRSFLAGGTFENLNHLNASVRHWIRETADQRIHGTTHCKPADRLKEERLMPYRPGLSVKQEYRLVGKDCLLNYKTNRYSVPWQYANREVEVMLRDGNEIQVTHQGRVIALHGLQDGKFQISSSPDHLAGIRTQQHIPLPREEVEIRPLLENVRFETGGAQ